MVALVRLIPCAGVICIFQFPLRYVGVGVLGFVAHPVKAVKVKTTTNIRFMVLPIAFEALARKQPRKWRITIATNS
jgi:hypothetical protein